MTSEKIIFYAMNGCGHCDNAKDALASEINSGKIKVLSNLEAPQGVQGFPHFVNTENKKTLTGWPGSKDNLIQRLEFKEFYHADDDIDDFFNTPIKDIYGKPPIPQNPAWDAAVKKVADKAALAASQKPAGGVNNFNSGHENYEHESMPIYPVVQSMENIPPAMHYYQGDGYSKLSNCWVKRPDFTS